jgi:hypothetical protein
MKVKLLENFEGLSFIRQKHEKLNKYYFGIGGLLIGIYLGYKYYKSRKVLGEAVPPPSYY